MAADHVLAQNSNGRAKWAAQVTNVKEYVSVNAEDPRHGYSCIRTS